MFGEHLIRDNAVGLAELIKNGYDADASEVNVSIENIKNPEKTLIVVEDNGFGMSEETLLGPWMDIATDIKEKQKKHAVRTPAGRLPLGEKGVGRFATQRLGRFLELVTRPKNSTSELHLIVDWDRFEGDVYVEDVKLDVKKRKPEYFTGKKKTGTLLKMTKPRYRWALDDLERLQSTLIKLLLPTKENKDFRVSLSIPEFRQFETLKLDPILKKYMFKIAFEIDSTGKCKYNFFKRSPEGKEEKILGTDFLWPKINPHEWETAGPSCGAFKGEVFAWLKSPEILQKYNLTADKLKALSGVSIYRNGFRILPYGDKGDDWLGLDKRRVQDPGRRFDGSQVIGLIQIDQTKNPRLIDKTNREGLFENIEYRQFREFVLGIVDTLENQSQAERTKISEKNKSVTQKKRMEKEVKLKTDFEQLKAKVVDLEKASNKPQPQEVKLKQTEVIVSKPLLDELKKKAVVFDSGFEDYKRAVNEATKELTEEREEKRDVYLHLMGIGLAAERFAHELDVSVASLEHYFNRLEKDSVLMGNPQVKADVENVKLTLIRILNETRMMNIFRFVADDSDTSQVYEVLKLSLAAHETEIEEKNIQVSIFRKANFEVNVRKSALAQVIDNIITNSIYWLSQKTQTKERKLIIELMGIEKRLIIGNTGPALDPEIKPLLFTGPFVTRKYGGRGLGMYISSQILSMYDAEIHVLDAKAFGGKYGTVAFEIRFDKS